MREKDTDTQSVDWESEFLELVERRLGIAIPPRRYRATIRPYLEQWSLEIGLDGPATLARELGRLTTKHPNFSRLVNVITIGETAFFRHPSQIQAIRAFLVAYYAKVKRPLAIWSAGSSTGEEPYSMAMLLHELGIPGDVLGTDLNAESISAAQTGDSYGSWSVRNCGPQEVEEYFERTNENFIVKPVIRNRVAFQRQNLVSDEPARPAIGRKWDLILCRNVFIYFSKNVIVNVLAKFTRVLAQHGAVCVGPNDLLIGLKIPLSKGVGDREALYFHQSHATKRVGREATPVPRNGSTAGRTSDLIVGSATYSDIVGLLEDNLHTLAKDGLEEYVRLNPSDAVAQVTLGNIWLKEHSYERALQLYRSAIRSDRKLAEPHYFCGVCLRKQGKLAEAEVSLRASLSLSARFWPAAYLLAGIFERNQNPLAAEMELERAEKILMEDDGKTDLFHSAAHIVQSAHGLPETVLLAVRQRLSGLRKHRSNLEVTPT
ncbi:MAG: hypothetical protein JKY56_20120 [Kofleriaceae bacterium]|nr:hypothetical protein [Kofleriaceae bacterium]